MDSLRTTASFFTRLPIPGTVHIVDSPAVHAAWLPVIGLALGVMLAAFDALLGWAAWPMRNALLATATLIITGALHLDALMDSVDGLSSPRAESERVMRASVHTAPGAVSGIVAIILLWLGLSALDSEGRSLWLVMTPLLGRGSILAGYALAKPGASSGMITRLLRGSAGTRPAHAMLLVTWASCTVVLGLPGLLAGVAACGAATLWLATIRLSGRELSGDHFGALAVLGELAVVITAGALAGRAA